MNGKYSYIILGAVLALIFVAVTRIAVWEMVTVGVVAVIVFFMVRGGKKNGSGGSTNRPGGEQRG